MKTTQTIEITIKDQTLILAKEEAQELVDILNNTLGIKPSTKTLPKRGFPSDVIFPEEHHKPIPPIWPQNPHKPEYPLSNPYPWKPPIIWCKYFSPLSQ